MRTTIDLPDEVHRKAKAEASLRGMKFKEYATALFQQGLVPAAPETKGRKEPIPVHIPVGTLVFPPHLTNADLFETQDREDEDRMADVLRGRNG